MNRILLFCLAFLVAGTSGCGWFNQTTPAKGTLAESNVATKADFDKLSKQVETVVLGIGSQKVELAKISKIEEILANQEKEILALKNKPAPVVPPPPPVVTDPFSGFNDMMKAWAKRKAERKEQDEALIKERKKQDEARAAERKKQDEALEEFRKNLKELMGIDSERKSSASDSFQSDSPMPISIFHNGVRYWKAPWNEPYVAVGPNWHKK